MTTNRSRRYRLEATGIPAAQVGQHQRALDAVAGDLDEIEGRLDAHEIPYTAADAADWSGDVPATVGAALDRIAAALGPVT